MSPTTITRLKSTWTDEYKQWASGDLSDKHYAYVWADGVHLNIRLKDTGAAGQLQPVVMPYLGTAKAHLHRARRLAPPR